MKTLQTTQKRAYTSPVMEVLEAENDMKFLMASAYISNESRAVREDFEEVDNTYTDANGGFKE